MEAKVNGFVPYSAGSSSVISTNGHMKVEEDALQHVDEEASVEELEREIPFVDEGQIPVRELLQRVTQAIYAELTEMAETCVKFSAAC